MRYSFSLFLILSITASSHAFASLKDGEYWTNQIAAQDLPPGFQNANLATPTLVTDDGGCSSAYISSSGHLLTAMHCIYSCLLKAGITEKKSPWANTPELELYVNDIKKLSNATCEVYVSGTKYQATITAVGPGYIPAELLSNFISHPANYNQAKSAGFVGAGDFAVLHISTASPTACLSGDHSSQVSDSDTLWSLGFPNYQSDQNGNWKKFLSVGKANLSAQENPAFNQIYAELGDATLANYVYNESGTIWSTIQGSHGSSGSAVFNSDSKLIGIVTDEKTPAPGALTGANPLKINLLKTMDAIIVDQYGMDAQKSMFECSSGTASPGK